MGLFLHIFTTLLFASLSFSRPCHKFNKEDFTVNCEDANLREFPNMEGFQAITFKLSGNNFQRITNTTFPPGLAREIEIMRNNFPVEIDSDAFSPVSSSLAVLKLQNVDIGFDEIFKPFVGLKALNSLKIGNARFYRDLTVPFLDDETLNRLIRLEVVHSGVEDVQIKAMNSTLFRRLRFLGFSFNKLQYVPEGIKHIMKLPQRQFLEVDLSHNLLKNVNHEWFPLSCSLTSLNLSYNKIRSIHLHALDKCPQLKRLDLRGNIDLLYINPSVFPSNCHLEPRMEVYVQHTGIRNVEFALRSCVGRVMYSNTNVPCNCRHMLLINCPAAGELIGECSDSNGQYVYKSDAWQQWTREGCYRQEHDELYNPQPKPEAGGSLASLKDWGDCLTNEIGTSIETQNLSEITINQSEINTETTVISIEPDSLTDSLTNFSDSTVSITPSPTTSSAAETNPSTNICTESDTNPLPSNTIPIHPSVTITSDPLVESFESIDSTASHTKDHEPTDAESSKGYDPLIITPSEIPNKEELVADSANNIGTTVTETPHKEFLASVSPRIETATSPKDEELNFSELRNNREGFKTSSEASGSEPHDKDSLIEPSLTIEALEVGKDNEPDSPVSTSGARKPNMSYIQIGLTFATNLLLQILHALT